MDKRLYVPRSAEGSQFREGFFGDEWNTSMIFDHQRKLAFVDSSAGISCVEARLVANHAVPVERLIDADRSLF